MASAYNELSFRTGLSYPIGVSLTIEPDDISRIVDIKNFNDDIIANYKYVGPTRVKERAYLNGTKLTVTYDDARRATGYSKTFGGHNT